MGCKLTNKRKGKRKMITRKQTIEGYLTSGLTWQIENDQNNNLHLTILWANGEELETIELNLEDIERLEDLFLQARGWYGAIAPTTRKKAGTE
jgi:hypothetical protein